MSTLGASGALAVCSHAHCAGGDVPCYYEPTIVYGPPCGDGDSFHPMSPRAINSAGQIAGRCEPCLGGGDTAFVWTADQGVVEIPMPPQTSTSEAVDITETRDLNELGQICGTASILENRTGPRGSIYDSGALTLLEPLAGDPSSFAYSLNSQLTAVGVSTGSLRGS